MEISSNSCMDSTGPTFGAEVFLEISVENGKENQSEEIRVPVIVGKKVGAGKSFYIGFDESWRWR